MRYYQIDYAYDLWQAHYSFISGHSPGDLPESLRQNRAKIKQTVPGFRAFTIGGQGHVNFQGHHFYVVKSDAWRLRDWVADIANGKEVPDVACTDCTYTGVIASEESIEIINRMIEILSEPGAWKPRDDGRPCTSREHPEPFTLRCAFHQATEEVTGETVHFGRYGSRYGPLIAWVTLTDAALRNIEWPGRLGFNSLTLYNNREGQTVEQILDLLNEVKSRIATGRNKAGG